MKHAVLVSLVAGTAAFSAQGSMLLSGANLETPLLIIWGLALLAVGQRMRSAGQAETANAKAGPSLTAAPVRAGAQAA